MPSLLSGDLTSRQPTAGLDLQYMHKGKILREGTRGQRDERSKHSQREATDEIELLEEHGGQLK